MWQRPDKVVSIFPEIRSATFAGIMLTISLFKLFL